MFTHSSSLSGDMQRNRISNIKKAVEVHTTFYNGSDIFFSVLARNLGHAQYLLCLQCGISKLSIIILLYMYIACIRTCCWVG